MPGAFAIAPRVCPSSRRPAPGALGFQGEARSAGVTFVRRITHTWRSLGIEAGAYPLGRSQLAALASGLPQAALASSGERNVRRYARERAQVVVLALEIAVLDEKVLPFLLGVAVIEESRLLVEQLLLVHPRQEAALLQAALERLCRGAILTYKGRCRELPALASRLTAHHLDTGSLLHRPHCDLIVPVRRLLSGCERYSTLGDAAALLGVGQQHAGDRADVDSTSAYQAWLQGSRIQVLQGIIDENERALLTTVALARYLCAISEARSPPPAGGLE